MAEALGPVLSLSRKVTAAGAGVHRCLGSNLARLEFQVGLERVLTRIPDFTLAPGEEAKFHGNSVTRGFRSVPVVFTPGKRSSQ